MIPPVFSICIPTYNRAHMLPSAIDSALAQTNPDYEIVIVDNASSDNTQDALNRYKDPRIRVIRNAKTVNVWANHNICIENARASWIVFLHSDETLCNNALSIFADVIAHTSGVGIVFPYYDRPVLQSLSSRPWFGDVVQYPFTVALTLNGVGPPSVACYLKRALLQIGMFPTRDDRLYCGDLQTSGLIALESFSFAFARSSIERRPMGPHRASYSLERTAAPEQSMRNALQSLRAHPNWQEAIQVLEPDIAYWPRERAARLLRIVALSGLSEEYRRLRKPLIERKEVLSSWDSKLAEISYYLSPSLVIKAIDIFRKIRR